MLLKPASVDNSDGVTVRTESSVWYILFLKKLELEPKLLLTSIAPDSSKAGINLSCSESKLISVIKYISYWSASETWGKNIVPVYPATLASAFKFVSPDWKVFVVKLYHFGSSFFTTK